MGVIAAFLLFIANPAAATLRVFACEPEWGALLKELAADMVDTYVATTAQQDPHKIQARPSLIAKFRQAELAVCTGAELEVGWLPALIEKANNPRLLPGKPGYFEASAFVEKIEIPQRLDRAEGDVHPQGNPHVHVDPRNLLPVAAALAARLAEIDPANAALYRQRHADFAARWQAAITRWQQQAAPLHDLPVVSMHRDGSYLFRWLGMIEVANLEPKPGVPPSAAHLQTVLEGLKARPARLILRTAHQDRRPAEWLQARSRLPLVELPYTIGGAPGTDDLFGLFDVTLEQLLAAAREAAAS